ncbi:TetR/AcrR family transcriptional regulator [Deinococcus aerolatus]|uniref:TetR/AcrR family transcriptional regulator n=1 Tax=Deinococcus aerolatus TaxID=522487 RepID=UPI003570CE89
MTVPTPPTSAPPTDTTRVRIGQEAARLFVASGYHGVSMREVAEAVGVTKPALYHHYADKEALFLAMLDGALAGLARLIAHASAQSGLSAQLNTLVSELVDSAPEQRVGLQLASELRHVSAARRQAFENEYRQVWMGGLSALFEAASARGELRTDLPPQMLTRAFLAIIYPLVTGTPPADPQGTARALLSVYLDGACPR